MEQFWLIVSVKSGSIALLSEQCVKRKNKIKQHDCVYPIQEDIIFSGEPILCSRHCNIVEVLFLPSNKKKKTDASQYICMDKRFFDGVELQNAAVIELKEGVGNGYFHKRGCVVAAKCSPETVKNGDLLISVTQEGQLYQYIQVESGYLLISTGNKNPSYLLNVTLERYYILKHYIQSF